MGRIPIKTSEELQAMREGGVILKEVLDAMERAVRPGISTLELDKLAESLILRHAGARPGFKGYHGYPATLCTSINEEVVHGIPSADRILKEGDIIGVDCGVLYKGFYTDACRTFLIGAVTPEVSYFVKITKKSLQEALKAVKAGAYVGDISAVIQKILEMYGFSPVIECTGHGVGRALHEEPEILNAGVKGTGPQLKAGMTLAIEPIASMGTGEVETLGDKWTIVTADGALSAHFEHTVAVTEKGHEIIV
ncbi:type I methionyl aminopeptidase [Candidatus Peregrinibacteria bacterium]|nr:type I methionyl aminopeptidase [Candidatus Peregrinibacteria bacterium]